MFQVKICGVTSVRDAQWARDAGADAIGLNFHAASPRFVAPALAEEIRAAIPEPCAAVGLFVNRPAEEISDLADRLRLDFLQLHGDESPELVASLAGHPLILAARCGSPFDAEAALRRLEACRELGANVAAVLVDARVSGQFGGTGQTANVEAFRLIAERSGLPTILAGGLTPDNVSEAIRRTGARAVDTASGVESEPGVKDLCLTHGFVHRARAAFEQIPPE